MYTSIITPNKTRNTKNVLKIFNSVIDLGRLPTAMKIILLSDAQSDLLKSVVGNGGSIILTVSLSITCITLKCPISPPTGGGVYIIKRQFGLLYNCDGRNANVKVLILYSPSTFSKSAILTLESFLGRSLFLVPYNLDNHLAFALREM